MDSPPVSHHKRSRLHYDLLKHASNNPTNLNNNPLNFAVNRLARDYIDKHDGLSIVNMARTQMANFALLEAASTGDLRSLGTLIVNKAVNLNFKHNNRNAIFLATQNNHIDALKYLIDSNPSTKQPSGLSENNPETIQAIEHAVTNNNIKALKELLKLPCPDINENTIGFCGLIEGLIIHLKSEKLQVFLDSKQVDMKRLLTKKPDYLLEEILEDALPDMILSLIKAGLSSTVIETAKNDYLGYNCVHVAIMSGRLDLLDEVLKTKININATSYVFDNTALHQLASLQNSDASIENEMISRLLIKPEIDINIQNLHGRTAYSFALEAGKTAILKSLAQRGANINLADKNGNAPLHILAALTEQQTTESHSEITRTLLLNPTIELNQVNNNGETALHLAVSQGNLELVEALLKNQKVNAFIADNNKLTAWDVINTLESEETKTEMLRLFARYAPLSYNKVVHLNANAESQLVLNILTEQGHEDAYEYRAGKARDQNFLFKNLLNPNLEFDQLRNLNQLINPMLSNVEQTHIIPNHIFNDIFFKVISSHLDNTKIQSVANDMFPGVPVEGQMNNLKHFIWSYLRSPELLNAAKQNDLDKVNTLLQRTINLNIDATAKVAFNSKLSSNGLATVYEAAVNGHFRIVEALLNPEYKLLINSVDKFGNTLLHWAVRKCNTELIQLLIHHPDIDVNIKNHDQNSPLVEAMNEYEDEIAQILLNLEGIDSDVTDKWGRNANTLQA